MERFVFRGFVLAMRHWHSSVSLVQSGFQWSPDGVKIPTSDDEETDLLDAHRQEPFPVVRIEWLVPSYGLKSHDPNRRKTLTARNSGWHGK